MKEKLGYDDALDVFGVHGCSGIWGSIATGICAAPFINEASGSWKVYPGQRASSGLIRAFRDKSLKFCLGIYSFAKRPGLIYKILFLFTHRRGTYLVAINEFVLLNSASFILIYHKDC